MGWQNNSSTGKTEYRTVQGFIPKRGDKESVRPNGKGGLYVDIKTPEGEWYHLNVFAEWMNPTTRKLLTPGNYVFAEGVYRRVGNFNNIDVKALAVLPGLQKAAEQGARPMPAAAEDRPQGPSQPMPSRIVAVAPSEDDLGI